MLAFGCFFSVAPTNLIVFLNRPILSNFNVEVTMSISYIFHFFSWHYLSANSNEKPVPISFVWNCSIQIFYFLSDGPSIARISNFYVKKFHNNLWPENLYTMAHNKSYAMSSTSRTMPGHGGIRYAVVAALQLRSIYSQMRNYMPSPILQIGLDRF